MSTPRIFKAPEISSVPLAVGPKSWLPLRLRDDHRDRPLNTFALTAEEKELMRDDFVPDFSGKGFFR